MRSVLTRGQMHRQSAPICPHCGSRAPHGDERHIWLDAHLESRAHRWWWGLKKWGKERLGRS